jgi:hypothetical protein
MEGDWTSLPFEAQIDADHLRELQRASSYFLRNDGQTRLRLCLDAKEMFSRQFNVANA